MRSLKTPRVLLIVATLCISFAAGCGSKYPETAPVRGKVTVGGVPVTTGRINFYPTSGARLSSGEIQPDGSYSLTTFKSNDGAFLGTHRVTITSTKVTGSEPAKSVQDESKIPISNLGRVVWLVDQKYSQQSTTDLQGEVKTSNNTIDFNLPTFASQPSS
jgi:hypothetical protein